MATVPLSGTNVRFLSNIPFNNDYKNTRWFTSKESQTTYFQSKPVVHAESEMNFQRIEGKHFVAINKSIDELWGANYIMFQNAHYNNKWFYAFISHLEYKQRNNTHVHFEIDVLQTWKFDMNFKPSYVVREHRPLWNNDGSPVINTIDEGLNYGTDYDNVYAETVRPLGNYKWMVMIAKNTLHDSESIEVDPKFIGVPQPLTYYVVPFSNSGSTPIIRSGSNDSEPISPPVQILKELYKDEQAVNNIVSIYITDHIGIPVEITEQQGSTSDIIEVFVSNVLIPRNIGGGMYVLEVNDFPQFTSQEIYSEGKYEGFTQVKESKLMMYPYTRIVLDDFKGNRVEVKPEFIQSEDLRIRVKGSLGTSNYTSYGIADYNRNDNLPVNMRVDLENETALINNTPEDITVLSDMLSAFLQGNRNSINTQRSQIMMNGVLGTLGSGVGVGASATAKVPNPAGVVSSGLGMVQGMGNTILDLQAIQSKQQDISNIPPQITKMGTNTPYNAGNRYNGIRIIKKQIKPEYIKILSDFFNMFGYKTNEVKIPNFRTRQYWNYVQTESCVITGNFNNQDLVELKTIFDSGITLWHTDDIGNYNLENGVI